MKTVKSGLPKSILAAECGSSSTTVVLIERGSDGFRLAATAQVPSTHNPPWADVTVGVQEAIRHIEKVIGRMILAPGGWPITPQNASKQGVDAFFAVVSAAPPLQVMLAGLTEEISLASVRRAAASTYTHVIGAVSLDDDNAGAETRIEAIKALQPEVIVLAGGTNNGAVTPVLEMAQMIEIALQFMDDRHPALVYAGNNDLRPAMADLLGPVTALKSVDNVRPLLDLENSAAARQELEQLYTKTKLQHLPGFDKLNNWSQYEVGPANKSFERLIEYIGRLRDLNVLGASLGTRSTVVVTRHANTLISTTRSDVGLGQSLATLLELIPVERIHRWLPFELELEALYDQLLNKSLYPNTIPTSPEDLMIEHAVAREALRLVAQQAQSDQPEQQWNLIIGGGRPLTGAPHAAHAAIVLLDGLEPWGVTNLAIDRSGVVNLLGALAAVEPMAAVQLAMHETFLNLGTVIAPHGYGQPGQPALKIKISRANIDDVAADDTDPTEPEEYKVNYGDMLMLPLPAHQKATVEIRPSRHFDIGLGQPGRGAVAEVEGGLLGIIIDARGRPLRLPAEDDVRRQKLTKWLKALNVTYAPPID